MLTFAQIWKSLRVWIDGLSRLDWVIGLVATGGIFSVLKWIASIPSVFSMPLGIICGCAILVAISAREALKQQRAPARIDIMKAQLVTIDSEIKRLNPEIIPNAIAQYREALDKAKLNHENRLAHHIDTTLNSLRQNLDRILKQASGATASGVAGILDAPELKKPICPPYEDENAFTVSGNELYVWEHGENIKAATQFQQTVQSKQDELRTALEKARQELLHECKKIEGAFRQ